MKKNKDKKTTKNSNGIYICDSIIMSVKKKKTNTRKLESLIIAVVGYVSLIVSFVSMFDFNYDRNNVIMAAIAFSAVYATVSILGKRFVWFSFASLVGGLFISYKFLDTLALGYKYVYNTIYHAAFHTEIEYYKFLKPELENKSITAFFIFYLWLLAVVIYLFTIYHPNLIPPILITFPAVEIGLYNGMEIPVFWGILLIGYWLALFSLSIIDNGEYSGGSGGFVRKENTFFPKRQMRLKVTEKCGLSVLIVFALSGLAASAALRLIDYERSDEINKKRTEVKDAVNSFSMENFADSVSDLTQAFGFKFKYENHHLGNVDRLRYKNTVDLVATFNHNIKNAVYLKEYTGSVYADNTWEDLPETVYSDDIFKAFEKYKIYPQDFNFRFDELMSLTDYDYTLDINSKLKGDRSFAPYNTKNNGGLTYEKDCSVSSKKSSEDRYSYDFSPFYCDNISASVKQPTRNVYSIDSIEDEEWRNYIEDYCKKKDIINYDGYFSVDSEIPSSVDYMYENPENIMFELIQEDYRDFVYKNYLEVPKNPNMQEIRTEFADILENAKTDTAYDKIALLNALRERVASMVSYSLTPGKTPANRDFVNYFLLENHKGYCVHYATSGVILARMAGIPARYAAGYIVVGDDFNKANLNSDGSYTIELRDNRAHAWTEVYLDGYGWVPFEFTAGYTNESINTTPTTTTVLTATTTTVSNVSSAGSSTSTHGKNKNKETKSTSPKYTSSASSETHTTVVTGTKPKAPKPMPTVLKYIIFSIAMLGSAYLIIWSRRKIIIFFRNKHFTEGTVSDRMDYIYKYTEKLFAVMGIERNGMQYKEFSEYIESSPAGKYFEKGQFSRLTDIALEAAFSENKPSVEDIEKCQKIAAEIAEKYYNESDRTHKLLLKLYHAVL